MEALRDNSRALRFASEELKHEREVAIEAVRQNGNALQYDSQELKRDREVLMEAVRPSGRIVVRFGLLRRS